MLRVRIPRIGIAAQSYTLTAAAGSFTLTGTAVSFRNFKLSAAGASFVLTGASAMLTYAPASGAITYNFTLRETLADSPNSPRDTALSITVTPEGGSGNYLLDADNSSILTDVDGDLMTYA